MVEGRVVLGIHGLPEGVTYDSEFLLMTFLSHREIKYRKVGGWVSVQGFFLKAERVGHREEQGKAG